MLTASLLLTTSPHPVHISTNEGSAHTDHDFRIYKSFGANNMTEEECMIDEESSYNITWRWGNDQ